MENVSQFDLNAALQRWIEKLARSPEVKTEDLKELESHIHDSVVQLQSKGLSPQESFMIATHRIGTPETLEPEFAKINNSPLNKIVHGLVLVFFSVGSWFIWALLQLPRMMAPLLDGRPLFTRLMVGWGSYWYILPGLAALYCFYVWTGKSRRQSSWTGFFAFAAAILFLITISALVAVLLPVIDHMNHASH